MRLKSCQTNLILCEYYQILFDHFDWLDTKSHYESLNLSKHTLRARSPPIPREQFTKCAVLRSTGTVVVVAGVGL